MSGRPRSSTRQSNGWARRASRASAPVPTAVTRTSPSPIGVEDVAALELVVLDDQERP